MSNVVPVPIQVTAPESLHSGDLVMAIINTQNGMQACVAVSGSSGELQSIFDQLCSESTAFDGCTRRSAQMLQNSAWTAEKMRHLMDSVHTLDKSGLEGLVADLHSSVEQTKREVWSLVEELRKINQNINIITDQVTTLISSVEERQRSAAEEQLEIPIRQSAARASAKSAYKKRDGLLAGVGICTIVLAVLFPPAIPVLCCVAGCAACKADDEGDNYQLEEVRLQGVQSQLAISLNQLQTTLQNATQLRNALPTLLQSFNQVYDFWQGIDTAVKAIRIEGTSKLMYKSYGLGWIRLQSELGQNAQRLLSTTSH